MRLKIRFLICEAMYEGSSGSSSLSCGDIQIALRDSILRLYGEVGSGEFGTGVRVIFFDGATRILAIRSNRDAISKVRFALTSMNAIKGKSVAFQTLTVAGSSRTCYTKLKDWIKEYFRTKEESTEMKGQALGEVLAKVDALATT